MGPAIGDIGYALSTNQSQTSSDVVIAKNKIHNITCWNNEVPAAVEQNKPVSDMRG